MERPSPTPADALLGLGVIGCLVGPWLLWLDAGIYSLEGVWHVGAIAFFAGILAVGTIVLVGRSRVRSVVTLLLGGAAVGSVLWFIHLLNTAPLRSDLAYGTPELGIPVTATGGVLVLGSSVLDLVPDSRRARRSVVFVAVLLVTGIAPSATGLLIDDYRKDSAATMPGATLSMAVDAETDAVTIHHRGGSWIGSHYTRAELTIDGRRIVLEPTAPTERGALREGGAVTFRFDGSPPSAPWEAYAALPTQNITPDATVEVRVIDVSTGMPVAVLEERTPVSERRRTPISERRNLQALARRPATENRPAYATFSAPSHSAELSLGS